MDFWNLESQTSHSMIYCSQISILTNHIILFIDFLTFNVNICLEGGKKKSSVQRSEEVRASGDIHVSNRICKQASKDSTDGSIGSISSDSGSV